MVEEKPRKWRYGVNRWIVLAMIILSVVAWISFAPILPHIQLPAEPLFNIFGTFNWTNTMTAMVIADILLLLLGLYMRNQLRKGNKVLTGLAGAVEAILELIVSQTETTAGKKWTRKIVPLFATITLLVLVVNWMELIPGVDSIGKLEEAPAGIHGYPTQTIAKLGNLEFVTIVKGESAAAGETAGESAGAVIVPFVRVLSTDLNFTVGLALISVFATQYFGWKALGGHYFNKFFNVGGLFKKPIFGVIDLGVGILELISEISKVLSFSFRLFGNIFAGSVLLFVIGSLVPVLFPSVFLMLEFFVGLIQAVVFGMLTMVFIAQAVQGHET